MASQGKKWPSREGFTADVLTGFIRSTVLNPWIMVPLFALAQYSGKGRAVTEARPHLLKALRVFASLGLLNRVSAWLDHRSANNGLSDTYDWNKEIIVLTGGSNGIGRIVAQQLGDRGIKVAILDITPPSPAELPKTVRFYECDITSPEAITEVATQIRTSLGRPTILINNAGILPAKTILEISPQLTRRLFEINNMSHYWLTQEFLPDMVKNNHGMVVTVASQAGYTVAANMVTYCATKAATIAFHEGLSTELVTRLNAPKVRTVLVTQSFTRTTLIDGLTPEDGFIAPLLYPETVAENLVKQVLTGQSGHVNVPGSSGWISTHLRGFPLWFQNAIRNSMEESMRVEKNK
ncbi:uncharacterized protein N7483_004817 [Penicillium malachiteum]|uniref:uncharacterized protein n=1 Tax=Penicillium malachiteum TaxID=1324776 RepID=UPI0025482668|nr:uncharacterized protein N7483_004817 [Penicillium malachiteum]KAJ5730309.1 hypothetical protein N7483_004817 [Penicillium malachiteum]